MSCEQHFQEGVARLLADHPESALTTEDCQRIYQAFKKNPSTGIYTGLARANVAVEAVGALPLADIFRRTAPAPAQSNLSQRIALGRKIVNALPAQSWSAWKRLKRKDFSALKNAVNTVLNSRRDDTLPPAEWSTTLTTLATYLPAAEWEGWHSLSADALKEIQQLRAELAVNLSAAPVGVTEYAQSLKAASDEDVLDRWQRNTTPAIEAALWQELRDRNIAPDPEQAALSYIDQRKRKSTLRESGGRYYWMMGGPGTVTSGTDDDGYPSRRAAVEAALIEGWDWRTQEKAAPSPAVPLVLNDEGRDDAPPPALTDDPFKELERLYALASASVMPVNDTPPVEAFVFGVNQPADIGFQSNALAAALIASAQNNTRVFIRQRANKQPYEISVKDANDVPIGDWREVCLPAPVTLDSVAPRMSPKLNASMAAAMVHGRRYFIVPNSERIDEVRAIDPNNASGLSEVIGSGFSQEIILPPAPKPTRARKPQPVAVTSGATLQTALRDVERYAAAHRTPGRIKRHPKWDERVEGNGLGAKGVQGALEYLAQYGNNISAAKLCQLAQEAETHRYTDMAHGFWIAARLQDEGLGSTSGTSLADKVKQAV